MLALANVQDHRVATRARPAPGSRRDRPVAGCPGGGSTEPLPPGGRGEGQVSELAEPAGRSGTQTDEPLLQSGCLGNRRELGGTAGGPGPLGGVQRGFLWRCG